MTRTEQIEAAKSFTEKHKDSHRVFLEEGYIEATIAEMVLKNVEIDHPAFSLLHTKRIWAIDANGIATTDY
jgi:hypothetical protein